MSKEKEKRDYHRIFTKPCALHNFSFIGERGESKQMKELLNGNSEMMRNFLERLWHEIYYATRYVESPVTVKRIVYRFLKYSCYYRLGTEDRSRAFKVLRLMLEFLIRGHYPKNRAKAISFPVKKGNR